MASMTVKMDALMHSFEQKQETARQLYDMHYYYSTWCARWKEQLSLSMRTFLRDLSGTGIPRAILQHPRRVGVPELIETKQRGMKKSQTLSHGGGNLPSSIHRSPPCKNWCEGVTSNTTSPLHSCHRHLTDLITCVQRCTTLRPE